MRRTTAFRNWMTIKDVQPELAVAQFMGLSRQVPLLYALLSVNAVAVAYTHSDMAPAWLTTIVPAILVVLSTARFVFWIRHKGEAPSPARAVALLRRTSVIAAVLAGAYIAWALSLGLYGGPAEHAHLAIFISITAVGCVFCLSYLPQAAVLVVAIISPPYLAYYVGSSDPIFIAIALNIFLVTAVMLRVLLNAFAGLAALVRSQAETERLGRENARLAHTDALTGLPNRRLFFAELDAQIGSAAGPGNAFAVGVVDLDRFKPVNDTFGHLVGDRLLEAVAGRLRTAAGPNALVARLGGDEFGLIVAGTGAQALAIAPRICSALSEPFDLGEVTVTIGATCGLATPTGDGCTAHLLFDRADYALYSLKASRRGAAALYSAEHELRLRSGHAVEAALQTADLAAEIEVHLQPIVQTTGDAPSVISVEALARWTSPTLGRVRPDVFIPVAERTGMIHRLTTTLFGKSLAVLETLPETIRLSFNLSAHDLTNPKTVLGLLAAIRRSSVAPSRIIFELTETAVMRDFAIAEASIRLLRAPGVSFALDDFGTGHSSLNYLHRLPIDAIKIDRSFVTGVADEAGRTLLAAILALSRSMKLACVAEGVEDAGQLAALRDLGFDTFQGYHFAMPMPPAQFLASLPASAHKDRRTTGAA